MMVGLDNQSARKRVERIPGNFDNFFEWLENAPDTIAKKPVKKTVCLLKDKCRNEFETIFKKKDDGLLLFNASREDKEAFESSRTQHEKRISAIEALEDAFAGVKQAFPEYENYELALIGEHGAFVTSEELAELKDFHEDEWDSDNDYIKHLPKKSASPYNPVLERLVILFARLDADTKNPGDLKASVLVRRLIAFAIRDCDKRLGVSASCDYRHALEITNLIHYHDNGKMPEGRGLYNIWRAVMGFYGFPLKA